MLVHLSITNYLLIDSLELDLRPGLSIITGATGSGKSILIGALGLAMGDRGGQVALDPAKRCVIELECDLGRLDHLRGWFDRAELPFEVRTILRRQYDPGGRSRAFINDTPVRLEQLRALAAALVHIHSQHHTLLLNDPAFLLGLLDHVAGTQDRVTTHAGLFAAWKEMHDERIRMEEIERRQLSERDFLQFQLDELDAAGLKPGERTQVEADLARAEHASEVLEALQFLDESVNREEGVMAILFRSRQLLDRYARSIPEVMALAERLDSVRIELKDLAAEAAQIAGTTEIDPKRATHLRGRLDLLLRLEQKHHVDGTDALIALRDRSREQIQGIGILADRTATLRVQEAQAHETMLRSATALSAARKAMLRGFSANVEEALHDLGMPGALFRCIQERIGPGPTGMDRVRAEFSADADRPPAPLDRVASGGELGRVMLALIDLAADSRQLPTVIFDEIDTGVSGEVADRVGDRMSRMAQARQVIAITHLPQIASKADDHLLVTKDDPANGTRTRVERLDRESRVLALAQMLSGKRTSKAALANARELLRSR
ncbi:MAG: DNA repair protein RecN [Flavobacteriales bacterium]|nr:DNA repair protein RecN [Flavobacteriales bacterium]